MRAHATFPLVPRRRVVGHRVGEMPSVRRGGGYDVVTTRPYRPGDDIRRIDRYASARLSLSSGRDEFVVREHYAEEATRVVVVVDRSPSMALFPEGLPWLQKPAAVREATAAILASAAEAHCPVHRVSATGDGGIGGALAGLGAAGPRLAPGAFVFVLSDFLASAPDDAWRAALARGWDVVPVLVQDAVWEESFPDVAGAVLPLVDPESGRVRLARVSRAEVRERRERNEARLGGILDSFSRLGLVPVRLARHEPEAVRAAFLEWANARRRGARWLR